MVGATGEREHHIPMSAQLDKDAHGAFWLFTATDNRLAAGGPAMAQFAAKGHALFACIYETLVYASDRTVPDQRRSHSITAWDERTTGRRVGKAAVSRSKCRGSRVH